MINVKTKLICCATCKNRHGERDKSGIVHCNKLNKYNEILCIARNYQKYEEANE